MKTSLCMIVKDVNSKEFKQCIDSVFEYVDEILVASDVDADYTLTLGTRDDPKLSAKVQILAYKWKNDFADARNFIESKATGDVIFWLDSDDTVLHAEKLPELYKKIEEGVDCIHLEYLYAKDEHGRVQMRQWKPRLYKKGIGHWEKSVHENWLPDQEIVQIMDDSVKIEHQHGGLEHQERSALRNLGILMTEYAKDGEATDPRTLYYLGNTLMGLGRWQEAAAFYRKHIAVCGWPEEKFFAMHYLGECLQQQNRLDEAINVALESLKLFPVWSLAYFDIAKYYSLKNDALRVIEWTLTGLTKDKPDSRQYFTSDLDYTVNPMARLAYAYLQVGKYEEALGIAKKLTSQWPEDDGLKELLATCEEAVKLETFVESFITVANMVGNTDRIKGSKLFDCLPNNLDEDARIQAARLALVPPKNWEQNSIVIYCGKGNGEAWGPPSVHTGIGGSEEAVINMSRELTKLGYKVTVYNECGDFRGVYGGVTYLPYFHFNQKDSFNILISWRTPGLFGIDIKAKKRILWLHDIAYPQFFNKTIVDNCDKIVFLSKWHRNNLPEIPEEKVFISNNGINPADFVGLPAKKPNSLFWGSSYDRGLLCLVRDIMPLVRKEVPDVTLDVCYGWDNIDREIEAHPGIYPELEKLRAELTPLLEQPYITHHGRVSHKKVAELMGQSVCLPYSSEFGETNNITAQKAQAAGCYVITTPQAGGTPERIRYGTVIKGQDIYTNKKTQEEFAERVIERIHPTSPGLNVNYHKELPRVFDPIREEFSWETTAKHWKEGLL